MRPNEVKMDTPTNSGAQAVVSEIERALSLAEEVSLEVDRINSELTRTTLITFFFMTVMTAMLAWFIPLKNRAESLTDSAAFLGVIGILAMLTAAVTVFVVGRNSQKRKALDIERRILSDLIETVAALSSLVEGHVSSVDHKLLELRMRRLSLSARPKL
jgi:hypothetical protein